MAREGTGSPMWLTHHWPDQQERCAAVGSHLVCRRCAVLYPLAVLAAAVVLAFEPTEVLAVVAMWLLPLPMTLEWVAEHRGEVAYSPLRQSWLTALAALGIGAALAAHLRQPFDADALAPMATHATICGVSALRAARAPSRTGTVRATTPAWEVEHERSELERASRLRRLLEEQNRGSAPTE